MLEFRKFIIKCVFLDEPQIQYDENFLKLYFNCCLTLNTTFLCGMTIDDFTDNILYLSSTSKRTYARHVLATIKCLAYLTKSRIAITDKYQMYEQTALYPIIVTPTMPNNTCIFSSCHGMLIKAQPLLNPQILLEKQMLDYLNESRLPDSEYFGFKDFISQFKLNHKCDQDLQYDDDIWKLDCSFYNIRKVIIKSLASNNQHNIVDFFGEAISYIITSKSQILMEMKTLPYSLLDCPIIRFLNKHHPDWLDKLRVTKTLDGGLFYQEVDKIAQETFKQLNKGAISCT